MSQLVEELVICESIDEDQLSIRLKCDPNYEVIVGALFEAINELNFRFIDASLEETIDEMYTRVKFFIDELEANTIWKDYQDFHQNHDQYLYDEVYSVAKLKIGGFEEDELYLDWIPF